MSIKLYVQTLIMNILPESNRAVTGKEKRKNIQSKMTELGFLFVYAEGIKDMHGGMVRQRVRHEWKINKQNHPKPPKSQ